MEREALKELAIEIMENCKKKREEGEGPDFFVNVYSTIPNIIQVIYNEPATIVCWADATKTVVKCTKNDTYSRTTGLALCIVKKMLGEREYKSILKEWLPKEEPKEEPGD